MTLSVVSKEESHSFWTGPGVSNHACVLRMIPTLSSCAFNLNPE